MKGIELLNYHGNSQFVTAAHACKKLAVEFHKIITKLYKCLPYNYSYYNKCSLFAIVKSTSIFIISYYYVVPVFRLITLSLFICLHVRILYSYSFNTALCMQL